MAGMLEAKSALVTGGGGGIGRAAALAFSREGANVAVADLVPEAAEETVVIVNRAGGQAMSLTGDITDASLVQDMIRRVMATYGRLDCAFSNAGIAPWQVDAGGMKTADWSEASFDRMIAVNLKSVWLCMKYEILQMQAQGGGGSIVNTSSIRGLVGLANGTGYTAAKHGVIGLTKTAALEYADDRIRVNAVCPGFIRTAMTAETQRERAEQITSRTPMGRSGGPDEIAEMVVWLCSDRASYVTGSAYAVDGTRKMSSCGPCKPVDWREHQFPKAISVRRVHGAGIPGQSGQRREHSPFGDDWPRRTGSIIHPCWPQSPTSSRLWTILVAVRVTGPDIPCRLHSY